MIEIEARPCPAGHPRGMEILAAGHAGMAPVGQDIVCAGVSALLFGFLTYVESLSPVDELSSADQGGQHVESFEWDGGLYLRTCGLGDADLRGWAVTVAGLRLIAEAYPQMVRLTDRVTTPVSTSGGARVSL